MNKNVYIAGLVSLINSVSLAVVIPVLYTYAKFYGLNDIGAASLLTVFTLSQFFASPFLGKLSDKFGRKPVLTISLIGTVFAGILSAFAPSAIFLFFARILDGLTGGNNSVAQAVIIDSTTAEQRPKGFAIYGASFGIGFAVGPLLGWLVMNNIADEAWSLKSMYLISSGLAVIGTLITTFVLTETSPKVKDLKIKFSQFGFTPLMVGLRRRDLRYLFILFFAMYLAFGIFQFSIQPYVTETLDRDNTFINAILTFIGVFSIFAVAMIKPIQNRIGLKNMAILSIALWAIFFLGFSLMQSTWYIFLLLVPDALGANLFRPAVQTLITTKVSEEDQGYYSGILDSFFNLGFGLGPVLGGIIVTISNGWYQSAFFACGTFCLVLLGVYWTKRNQWM